NDRSIRATTTWFNATGTPNGNWYGGLTVRAWEGNYEVWELAGPSHNSNTRNGLYYRSGLGTVWNAWERVITDYNWQSIIDGRYLPLTGGDMSANIVFSADNIGILFKGEAYNALHKSGDNYIFGSAERGIVLRNYNSDLVHSKAGTNYYILDTSNWAGYIDGRYLQLAKGGILNGKLTISLTNHHPLTLSANGAGN
ncbi:hypothetical protein, partial [Bacteroides sp.]|uniref:hypothetical protein n=1 Tax=Bacteroides sp. TaxID=29523 RepID=UPI002FCB7859